MARGKAATEEFSFDTIEVQAVTELPKGVRDTAPNPLEGAVNDAVDQGPRALPVPNGERAMEAQRLLRRAVAGKYGLSVRFTDADDKPLTPQAAEASTETVWVYFDVKGERKEREYAPRKYTTADIRTWANLDEGTKVTKEIRDAYRAEHGFNVRK